MCFKILPEQHILFHQTVVGKRADEEEGNQCADDRQTTADPEWPGIATISRWATEVCKQYESRVSDGDDATYRR